MKRTTKFREQLKEYQDAIKSDLETATKENGDEFAEFHSKIAEEKMRKFIPLYLPRIKSLIESDMRMLKNFIKEDKLKEFEVILFSQLLVHCVTAHGDGYIQAGGNLD